MHYLTNKLSATKELVNAINLGNLTTLKASLVVDFFDAKLDFKAGVISPRMFHEILVNYEYLVNAISVHEINLGINPN